MISFFRSEAKGLFFFVPLEVALHDYNTPILDDIDEHSFLHEFLNPAIDNHIVFTFVAPGPVIELSVFFLFHIFIFYVFVSLLVDVETIGFNNWNVGGRADVVGCSVTVTVCAFVGSGNFEQTHERQSLIDSSAHLLQCL